MFILPPREGDATDLTHPDHECWWPGEIQVELKLLEVTHSSNTASA